MKKGRVFFHPIEGSGALTISWSAGSKGDAIEAKNGSGVGFFSERGDLLCVIFDEVQADRDRQMLSFSCADVEVIVEKGKITYSVNMRSPIKTIRKRATRRKQPIKKA